MQKYIEKMKIEKAELDGRITRAEQAIVNPPYGADCVSIDLLQKQVRAMRVYQEILQKRIEYEVGK